MFTTVKELFRKRSLKQVRGILRHSQQQIGTLTRTLQRVTFENHKGLLRRSKLLRQIQFRCAALGRRVRACEAARVRVVQDLSPSEDAHPQDAQEGSGAVLAPLGDLSILGSLSPSSIQSMFVSRQQFLFAALYASSFAPDSGSIEASLRARVRDLRGVDVGVVAEALLGLLFVVRQSDRPIVPPQVPAEAETEEEGEVAGADGVGDVGKPEESDASFVLRSFLEERSGELRHVTETLRSDLRESFQEDEDDIEKTIDADSVQIASDALAAAPVGLEGILEGFVATLQVANSLFHLNHLRAIYRAIFDSKSDAVKNDVDDATFDILYRPAIQGLWQASLGRVTAGLAYDKQLVSKSLSEQFLSPFYPILRELSLDCLGYWTSFVELLTKSAEMAKLATAERVGIVVRSLLELKAVVRAYVESFHDRDVRYVVRIESLNEALWKLFEGRFQTVATGLIRGFLVDAIAGEGVLAEVFLSDSEDRRESHRAPWEKAREGERECLTEKRIWERYQHQAVNPYSGMIFLAETKEAKEVAAVAEVDSAELSPFDDWKARIVQLFELIKDERKHPSASGSPSASSKQGPLEKCLYASLFGVARLVLKHLKAKPEKAGDAKAQEAVLLARAQRCIFLNVFFEDLVNELHVQSRKEISTLGLVPSHVSLRAAWSRSSRSDSVLEEFFVIQKDFEETFVEFHRGWMDRICRESLVGLRESVKKSGWIPGGDVSGLVRNAAAARSCWPEFFIKLSDENVRLPTTPSHYVMSACIHGLNERIWELGLREDQHSLLIGPLTDVLRREIDGFYLEYTRGLFAAIDGHVPEDGDLDALTLASNVQYLYWQLLFDVSFLHEVLQRAASSATASRRSSGDEDDVEAVILAKVDPVNWEVYEKQFRENVVNGVTRSSIVCGFLCCGGDDEAVKRRRSSTRVIIPPDEKFIKLFQSSEERFDTLGIPDKIVIGVPEPAASAKAKRAPAAASSRSRRAGRRRGARQRRRDAKNADGGFLADPIGTFLSKLW